MDPVSAVGLAAAAAQLAGLCVSVGQTLSKFNDQHNRAGRTIRGIRHHCKVVEVALRKIQRWVETTLSEIPAAAPELAALHETILNYTEELQDLKRDIDATVGTMNSDSLRFIQRLKVVWRDDVMKEHLQELHNMGAALHLLLDATQL